MRAAFFPSLLGRRESITALFLLALTTAVAAAAPAFRSAHTLHDLLANAAPLAVAAAGMTLVIVAGGIDISVGSMLAVCAVVAGKCANAGWPLPAVAAGAVLTGAALGSFNGLLVSRAGVPAIIATLGTMSILRGLLVLATRGAWIPLPETLRTFGTGRALGVPLVALSALPAVALAGWFLGRTVQGRAFYATGSNPAAARLAGIDVAGVTQRAFLLCGAMTGLAAFLYAARFTTIQSNAGQGFELVVITAVVVGGTNIFGGSGSVLGSLLGVLLLGVVGSAPTFVGLSEYWEQAVQGLLILLAVVTDRVAALRRAP
ncbi:MAG: ABC transporter permease [Armatimonadota bacterium]|nr:ABC transporter permease [Armatimonadota bacterium]